MKCSRSLAVLCLLGLALLHTGPAHAGRTSVRATEDYDEDEATSRAETAIADIEEADRREQETDSKIEASHDVADEAELEEEEAEAKVAEEAIAAETAKHEASPDGALERLMAELVEATYRLRDVNKQLKVLD